MNTILERISESDINQWLEARTAQIAERTKLPISSFGPTLCVGFDATWYLHAHGKCVCRKTIAEAIEELKTLVGDPASLAKSKREDAARLLAEAEALEGKA